MFFRVGTISLLLIALFSGRAAADSTPQLEVNSSGVDPTDYDFISFGNAKLPLNSEAKMPALIDKPDLKKFPVTGNSQTPADWVKNPYVTGLTLDPTAVEADETPFYPETIPTPSPSMAPATQQLNPRVSPQSALTSPSEVIIPLPKVDDSEEKKIKLWEGSFQIGFDGSEGNSESMNIHLGADVKRKQDVHLLYVNVEYNRKNADYTNTTNKLYSQERYERIIRNTNWSLFWEATGEYDEFQEYEFRVTSHAGVGRMIFKTLDAVLKGRFGAGFSHEFGGPRDDYYAPELLLAFDYERKVFDRQKLIASVEYMPDMSDFTEYRLNSYAGWEVQLDDDSHLNLRFAVRNRYNSASGKSKPNDLDYAALLLWKF